MQLSKTMYSLLHVCMGHDSWPIRLSTGRHTQKHIASSFLLFGRILFATLHCNSTSINIFRAGKSLYCQLRQATDDGPCSSCWTWSRNTCMAVPFRHILEYTHLFVVSFWKHIKLKLRFWFLGLFLICLANPTVQGMLVGFHRFCSRFLLKTPHSANVWFVHVRIMQSNLCQRTWKEKKEENRRKKKKRRIKVRSLVLSFSTGMVSLVLRD